MTNSNQISISLITACINGNQDAFKEVYKMYLPLAKKICVPYADTYEDVEELIDDTFIKVFDNLEKYDVERPFSAWFRTIAVNTCINYYRAKKKVFIEDIEDHYTLASENENILSKFNYQDLVLLLNNLNINHRTIFLLHIMEGYSHKEIAEKLGINEITCRTGLNKARVALQKMILDQA